MRTLYKMLLIFVLVFISCQPLPENGKWTEINTTIKPEARCGFEMVNAEDKKIILFGGAYDIWFNDTWEFNISSNTWRKIEPTINPNERAIFGMAYGGKVDNKNRIIIFSGFYESTPFLSDTWEYNVEDEIWTQCNDGVGPGNISPIPIPRMRHSMEYIGNNKILLFGGQKIGGILLNDLWEYDVSTHTWSEISSIAGTDKPQGRQDFGMAFNQENRKVVIFGGFLDIFDYANDTWEYDIDKKIWTQYSLSYKPSTRNVFNIVYIGNNKVMLFGGENEILGDVNDTWIYDMASHNWSSCIIQDTKPIRRGEYGMVGLPNQKAYLFGGWTSVDTKDLVSLDDMWLFELLE